jgi:hypothetical protein
VKARAAEAQSIGVQLEKLHRQQQVPVSVRNRLVRVVTYST